MPIYINDYIADTMDLTAEEHGIYFMLLMHYWKKGPLPTSETKLLIITKSNNVELLNGILDEYFIISGGKYHNKRIEEEMKKAESRRESNHDRDWETIYCKAVPCCV